MLTVRIHFASLWSSPFLSRARSCCRNGYGAYAAVMPTDFSSDRIPLLKRGIVYAIAHVRGGGEMGQHWYEEGKMLNKMNSVEGALNSFFLISRISFPPASSFIGTDFIACAEHLLEQNRTLPSLLAASGRSAGGVLMGATANVAGSLFKAMLVGMPFVDVINTMIGALERALASQLSCVTDPSIPLTAMEWEEWGNPLESSEVYHYMKRYSPYDNVTAQRYPHMLVTSGLYDPRVQVRDCTLLCCLPPSLSLSLSFFLTCPFQYWEPTKWVAKLRALKTDKNLLLLKTFMSAGHAGPSGRYTALRELAHDYAFVLDRLEASSSKAEKV